VLAERSASIFFLTRSLNLGGAERQLVQIASGLSARGHEVTVAVFYEGKLDAELRSAGVRLLNLGKRGRWDLVRFTWRLISAIRSARPDVLYAFLGTSNIIAATVQPFLPPLKLVWSVRASNMDVNAYDRVSRISYRVECALSRRADLIISNSRAGMFHAAAHGFPRARMQVIPNGIDTDRFYPDKAVGRALRSQWGVAESEILVGLLARFDPMKDHANFLQAAARIATARPALRFACVGEGPPAYIDELKRLAASLGFESRMLWPGPFADPFAPLNAFDICCSSSAWGEGFSNSIAEAMACGVPCVVTDVGDSAFIVGSTGKVVPPQNCEALAQAIIALVDKLEAGEEFLTRERVLRCFSIEQSTTATEYALLAAAGDHSTFDFNDREPAKTSSQNSA